MISPFYPFLLNPSSATFLKQEIMPHFFFSRLAQILTLIQERQKAEITLHSGKGWRSRPLWKANLQVPPFKDR